MKKKMTSTEAASADIDALLSFDSLRPNVRNAIQTLQSNVHLQPITDPPLREVAAMRFGVLGPEEILGLSVCEVSQPKISHPLVNTSYDERMGSIGYQKPCTTCGETVKNCPNHYGHIKLAVPILHPQFLDNIKSLLQCICLDCSSLLLKENEIDLELYRSTRTLKYKDRLKSIEELSKGIPFCRRCSANHPTITLFEEKIYKVYEKHKTFMSPEEIRAIFERISNDDLRTLGYNLHVRHATRHGIIKDPIQSFRPEWMVMTYLLVLPPISRPPAFDGDLKNDDDLTSAYIEIIKRNQKLLNPSLKEKQRKEIIEELATHIRTFIDNSDDKTTHTSGKPYNSIKQRISGKKGHMRGKLMGKRVDSSARTVITGDPTLRLNEVGVPHEIARELTFPEEVSFRNIQRLTDLLDEGKIKVVKRGNLEYHQEICRTELQYGDVVYRHLQNGDRVVFNRQPTLHRGSMMSHVVRIIKGKTFRMNLSATKPYNADFDGKRIYIAVNRGTEKVATL